MMILHVDAIEAVWFIINAVGFLISLRALWVAQQQFGAAKSADRAPTDELYGARLLAARGNRRREGLRVVVQALFVSIVVPLLFSDRPIMLNPAIAALIIAALTLLASTLFDARDRSRMSALLDGLVRIENPETAREASVQEGNELTRQSIEITKQVGAKAEAAFHEANDANAKILDLRRDLIARIDQAVLPADRDSADAADA